MSDTPKNYESDTPETQEAVERWRQGKINIFDEMARLERERDEALNKAHNYEQGYLTHAARADTLEKERDEAREALQRITECDMRRSKFIARTALEKH